MAGKKRYPDGYWTYDRVTEESKKYSTRKDFSHYNCSAYSIACRKGWLNDYDWIEPSKSAKKWDYEACYEEAKKYGSRGDFLMNGKGAYLVACRNKWLDDYYWFSPSSSAKKWDYSACYAEALKYKSKGDFQANARSAYSVSWKRGWLKDYIWLKRRNREGSVYCVYVYEDTENKHAYVGLTCDFKRRDREHRKGTVSKGIRKYDYLYKHFNGNIPEGRILIDKVTPEDAQYYEGYYAKKYEEAGWILINKAKTGSLGTGVIKWTKAMCEEEAKKYLSKSEFKSGNQSAYDAARKNGWLKDYIWFKRRKDYNRKWNEEVCRKEALKYSSKKDFQFGNSSAYNAALRHGWLQDYNWLKRPMYKHTKWDKNICQKEACKYSNKASFRKNNNNAYYAARIHGWLDEFFPKAA